MAARPASPRRRDEFANDRHGFREAMPYTRLTGARGDRLIIDDPQAALEAESEADRKRALRTFRETVPLRINDAKTSAIVIIMQRLNDQDVSAAAIEAGYTSPYAARWNTSPSAAAEPSSASIRRADRGYFRTRARRDGELLFPPASPASTSTKSKKRWARTHRRPAPAKARPARGRPIQSRMVPGRPLPRRAPPGTTWCPPLGPRRLRGRAARPIQPA
jgi:hypothetical protein